jgi:hypothetical protein
MSHPPPTNPSINDDDARSNSGVESTAMTISSSLTHNASLMAKGEIPELTNFFKKSTVIEEEHRAFHDRGWLFGNVISTIPDVDVPTVHRLTILYFKSHLLAGLELPPSKFLAAIMNYLDCSLVHLNANSLVALSDWGFRQTPIYYGTITPRPGTPNSSMAESDYLCTITARMSISGHSSRVAGNILERSGFWSICMSSLHGRTSFCSLWSSRLNGQSC